MRDKFKILVTGSAGFIGHHLSIALRNLDYLVIGLDSLNSYYDTSLKYSRLVQQGFLLSEINYNCLIETKTGSKSWFIQLDLIDESLLDTLFKNHNFDFVINLAAQPGVRYSQENPKSYVINNLVGFSNILENCQKYKIKHLLFASSSSVYGQNSKIPFRTEDRTDHPTSFYAATKKANEVMAYSYAHLFNIPISGMRFFSVYGPWGRPDMAYFSFVKAISEGSPIKVFNNGKMLRDFTYVDDVVTCIVKLIMINDKSSIDQKVPGAPFFIYNIGSGNPESLLNVIHILETLLNKTAVIEFQQMPLSDVENTFADIESLIQAIDYYPTTELKKGLELFVNWYNKFSSRY